MKVTVELDLEGMVEQASALPEEIASPAEVHEGLREFYQQDGERHLLNAARRDEFVAHLSERIESHRVKSENARLKDEANRRMVVEHVRELLSRQVAPDKLAAATTVFIADHKFGLKDGRVIVVGRRGREDADMAAVNWIADEGRGFAPRTAAEQPGSLTAEIARLRTMH